MSTRSTFWYLLVIILFVTGLALVAIYAGDLTFKDCYGSITVVQQGEGCPTPPEK